MESTTEIVIAAGPDAVFALAAAVEDWPRILPHYRYVRRLAGEGPRRTLEMAAWRDIYPVRWRAMVEPSADRRALRFTHVSGPVRGMEVEWRLTPVPGGTRVVIRHHHEPAGLRRRLFAKYIAGPLFIENIATKTLRCMKDEAERSSRTIT